MAILRDGATAMETNLIYRYKYIEQKFELAMA